MPHAAISLLKGRSKETMEKVAKAVQEVLVSELGVKSELVSVSVEEVEFDKWNDHLAPYQATMVIGPEFLEKKKIRLKPGPVAEKPASEDRTAAGSKKASRMKVHLYTNGIPATAILMNKIPPKEAPAKAEAEKEEAKTE